MAQVKLSKVEQVRLSRESEILFQDIIYGQTSPPLLEAIQKKDVDVIGRILQSDPQALNTPLHKVGENKLFADSYIGSYEVFKILADHGMPISKKSIIRTQEKIISLYSWDGTVFDYSDRFNEVKTILAYIAQNSGLEFDVESIEYVTNDGTYDVYKANKDNLKQLAESLVAKLEENYLLNIPLLSAQCDIEVDGFVMVKIPLAGDGADIDHTEGN